MLQTFIELITQSQVLKFRPCKIHHIIEFKHVAKGQTSKIDRPNWKLLIEVFTEIQLLKTTWKLNLLQTLVKDVS